MYFKTIYFNTTALFRCMTSIMFLKMYNNDALWVYVEDGWSQQPHLA